MSLSVVVDGGISEFHLHTDIEDTHPVEELDSIICSMPSGFYVAGAIAVVPFTKFLWELVRWQEAALGTKLHHGVFIITTDKFEVAKRGLTHDCDICRAGTDRALAMMAENPEQEMLVGVLYWAGEP